MADKFGAKIAWARRPLAERAKLLRILPRPAGKDYVVLVVRPEASFDLPWWARQLAPGHVDHGTYQFASISLSDGDAVDGFHLGFDPTCAIPPEMVDDVVAQWEETNAGPRWEYWLWMPQRPAKKSRTAAKPSKKGKAKKPARRKK